MPLSAEVQSLREADIISGYDLSFEVISSQMTLADITALLEVKPSSASHEKGDALPGDRGTREVTSWRLFSDAGQDAPLEQHFEIVLKKMRSIPMPVFARREGFAADCKFRASVAVFFEERERESVLQLSPALLREINAFGIDLEVCLYPPYPVTRIEAGIDSKKTGDATNRRITLSIQPDMGGLSDMERIIHESFSEPGEDVVCVNINSIMVRGIFRWFTIRSKVLKEIELHDAALNFCCEFVD